MRYQGQLAPCILDDGFSLGKVGWDNNLDGTYITATLISGHGKYE